jgi:hypothetical protein
MALFNVAQTVLCEVNVWYTVEAENETEAAAKVALINCPTCVYGRDFEIIGDNEILSTDINEV